MNKDLPDTVPPVVKPVDATVIAIVGGAIIWAGGHYAVFPWATGFHLGPLIGFAVRFLVWPAALLLGAFALAIATGVLKDPQIKRSDGWIMVIPALWLSCAALAWPPADFGSAAIREAAAGPDFSKSALTPPAQELMGHEKTKPQSPNQSVETYAARLEREIKDIDNIDPKSFTGSVDEVRLGAAIFPTWAGLYDEGAKFDLTPVQSATRGAFQVKASKAQSRAFPILRASYAAAVDQAGWRENLDAKTLGDGNAIIEFVWVGFASNANIEDFRNQMREDFEGLRFREARFRWHAGPGEYTSYKLKPAADADMMVFEDGTFRLAKSTSAR